MVTPVKKTTPKKAKKPRKMDLKKVRVKKPKKRRKMGPRKRQVDIKKVEEWAFQGLYESQIIPLLGMSAETYYMRKREEADMGRSDIADAYLRGHARSLTTCLAPVRKMANDGCKLSLNTLISRADMAFVRSEQKNTPSSVNVNINTNSDSSIKVVNADSEYRDIEETYNKLIKSVESG